MDSKHPNFEQLIAPITRAEFFADYYGKKPLYVPGTEKNSHLHLDGKISMRCWTKAVIGRTHNCRWW